ncbi:MAG: 7-cyano-7-deazaguanine synthase QueC [Candidatus Cloacimonetes bacterium]|nr:7-cyano-7-deazaguanine synthase QueC [Candidatus Cloacimonadota bacterium]
MKRAIILASGGLDSLVTTAIAASENEEIYLLHVNYGQRTEKKELECFEKICAHYKPAGVLKTSIDYLTKIGGSSLTDSGMEIKDFTGTTEIPNTYVPFRNAHLLCIATSWAEVIGAQSIYIGAVEEDSSGYPDCRESFFESFNKTIALGTKNSFTIEVKTPVIHMNKAEIISKGIELEVPFEYSWSCYRSDTEACGTCDSCVLRLRAFKKAGVTDPIPYRRKTL